MSYRYPLLLALLSGALAAAGAGGAFAADARGAYPVRPVRIIVPFPAGGAQDMITRKVAQSLAPRLGPTIIVDNRPGAAGALGVQIAAKAANDGYTLVLVTASMVTPELLGAPTNIRRDFEPITQWSDTPSVLVVRAASPYKSIEDLLKDLRARPGKLSFGSAGSGTAGHLAVGLLASLSGGFTATHVPYRGGNETMPPLINGEIDFGIAVVPVTLSHISNGRLRALAVTLGERFPELPGVPTFQEAGVKGYRFTTWGGIAAPRGVDPKIVARLHREVTTILADAQVKADFISLGSVAVSSATPAAFRAIIEQDFVRLRKLATEIDLKRE
jgi:tripartite-type tricarboxylate transporter receptor subunit TctC